MNDFDYDIDQIKTNIDNREKLNQIIQQVRPFFWRSIPFISLILTPLYDDIQSQDD